MKALFVGTFDPPTIGHGDLIERGGALFDELLVAVPTEGEKGSLFSPAARLRFLEKMTDRLPNVKVASFTGLSAQFAKERGIQVLLRGVRSTVDLEYEKGLALANRRLTGCETLFLLASGEHAHISSTIIRDIGRAKGDLSPFIPEAILSEVADQLTL